MPAQRAALDDVRTPRKYVVSPTLVGAAVAIIIVSIIAAFVQMSDDRAPAQSYTEAS
jgi:hypothetical protein